MTNTNALNLIALNAFRAIENLPAFADYRKARHEAMLVEFETTYAAAAGNIAPKAKKTTKAKAPKKARTPSYKQLPHGVPSTIESPVAFVHGFLNAHPDMPRKASVAALIGEGINFATARTQYQRWYANRRAAAAQGVEQEGVKA